MLPLMEAEAVDRNSWVTKEEMLDIYTLSQCTPGVIAVNTATFIGRKTKGFFGALFATLGVITPSLIIISFIAAFFTSFADNPYVVHAFAGIRVAVAALMACVVLKFIKSGIKAPAQAGILIAAFITVAFLKISPVIIILVSGLFGFFALRGKEAEVDE